MFIKQTIRTEEGTITFQGELSQEEADMVIEVGLLTLLHNGAIPFVSADKDVTEGSSVVQ